VFTSSGQDYGVPVERVQEITFLSRIDDTFRNDGIEGVVQLRGSAIPVLSATRLLDTTEKIPPAGEETRILVLSAESFQYGLIVDGVREIVSIPDSAIMHSPLGVKGAVDGFYPRAEGNDIMLIRVDALIASKRRELSSVARLKTAGSEVRVEADGALCRHLITADCYLVFSIGPNFAIALRDVQEIIEPGILLQLPAQTGFDRRVLNLRGEVVPVIDLRAFFGYPEKSATQDAKLIVARNEERTIALEVDHILTIHKQVKYQTTPSLNPQLSHRKDTLDRLIEFIDESGLQTHVLVVNIEALMDNHLGMTKPPVTAANEIKENEHDHHATG
jgi:purine-binding chemotaxis protein CheW